MDFRKILQVLGIPVFLLLSVVAIAQDRVVTGRITDASGSGIPGVSVTVKGTTRGTTTDASGSYRLSVPANATLVLSSVGYGNKEVTVTGNSLNETLQTTTSNLNEVVVVGYGTRQKKDLTGSVSSVTSKDFQKGVITTPEQLIAGKVAGVSIISNGGQPGSGSTIRIRGGSSLSASNDPLIVIDGVPVEQGRYYADINPLSTINPNDIESFTVLKDASSAAIYGTRAANGVIIITTKKGRSGKLRVGFSTVNSVSAVGKHVETLTGDQVRSIVNENGTAAQKASLGTANTDWQSQIYQKAYSTDNNINFTGGIKGLPYRFSLGYLNSEGVLKTDRLQRGSAALALNPVLFDNHLKIDVNLKGSIANARLANTGAIGTAVYFDPTQPVFSNSKRFGGYFEYLDANGIPDNTASRNPVVQLLDYNHQAKTYRSIGNIQFDYKFHFLPDLRANLNLGYDNARTVETRFVSDSSSLEYNSKGENNRYQGKKQNTLLEFYLNYAKDISAIRSRVDVLAGYSYNNYLTMNYFSPSYYANGQKVVNSDPTYPADYPENTLISYFGRLNYTLLDRYLLTATIRRDGSSRFGPNNRWGTFPSVAIGWKINDESFLKGSQTISNLKLRLGYGVTGQQEGIGNYDYLSYYNLSNATASYQLGNNFYQMYRPGGFYQNRKWEETATYNAGLDYGFANNRVTGSIDFYLKKTTDLLNNVPAPAGTNFAAYVLANVGSMENKGVEFNINVQPIRNQETTLDVSFNATYNKNTITNLTVVPNDPTYIGFPSGQISGAPGFIFINAVGSPKNTSYTYKQIYDIAGRPIEGLFEDLNRDGIINEQDRYKDKQADPNLFFGLSSNFTHGKWFGGFTMRASFNNYVYNNIYSNNGRLNQIVGGTKVGNASANYLTTGFKGATNSQLLSDYYFQNGSFLRMDNINVGYNFGKISHNRVDLRANFSVQNVFVVTKYTGLDPEVGNGIDNNLYPRPRVYALGINLDF